MKEHYNNTKSGFTLIETLVGMTILLIIMYVGYEFIVRGFKATTFGSEQEEAISTARRAMNVITKELRGANASEQGDYALNTIEEQNIIFFCDIDDDDQMEKVRYFRDNDNLIKIITEPGPLNDYSVAPATTTLALYLNNQEEPLFIYYDSNNVETDIISEIRLVNINLRINVTPWRAPNDYYVETDVSFRNLKSNL